MSLPLHPLPQAVGRAGGPSLEHPGPTPIAHKGEEDPERAGWESMRLNGGARILFFPLSPWFWNLWIQGGLPAFLHHASSGSGPHAQASLHGSGSSPHQGVSSPHPPRSQGLGSSVSRQGNATTQPTFLLRTSWVHAQRCSSKSS